MSDTHRRVMNMICRGVLTRTHDASNAGIQLVEVSLLRDEAKVAVEHQQQYGFSAHAAPGAEVLVVFPSGNRDHGIVTHVENRVDRIPGLGPGEVALYTDEGDYLVFSNGNRVKLATMLLELAIDERWDVEAGEISIKGNNIRFEGNVTILGNVRIEGDLHVTGWITTPRGSL